MSDEAKEILIDMLDDIITSMKADIEDKDMLWTKLDKLKEKL